MTSDAAPGLQPRSLGPLHHLSLTVSDLERSVPWYCEVLGFEVIGDQRHGDGRTVVLALTDAEFTLLLQEHKAHEGTSFTEFRPGLDHLSFRLHDAAELDRWRARFDEAGVAYQSPRSEAYGSVLIFRDPDRIQLELFVDPGGTPTDAV
jgi:catechol 2,3-dioxygenase-like lactoylglutathione lyase family enzyme